MENKTSQTIVSELLDELKTFIQNNKNQKSLATSEIQSLEFQQNILQKEKEIALSNFNIPLANQLSTKLEEVQNTLAEKQAKISNEDIQREMTYHSFLKLKDLENSQIQEILNSTPELNEILGEWFPVLNLWLNK